MLDELSAGNPSFQLQWRFPGKVLLHEMDIRREILSLSKEISVEICSFHMTILLAILSVRMETSPEIVSF